MVRRAFAFPGHGGAHGYWHTPHSQPSLPQHTQPLDDLQVDLGLDTPSHVLGPVQAPQSRVPPQPLGTTPHAPLHDVTRPVRFGVKVTGALHTTPA
jgi:hypothetical protein